MLYYDNMLLTYHETILYNVKYLEKHHTYKLLYFYYYKLDNIPRHNVLVISPRPQTLL